MTRLVTYIKKQPYVIIFMIMTLLLLGIMAKDCYILSKNDIWVDEYVFLRLSSNFTEYKTEENWLFNKEVFSNVNLDDPVIITAYNHPVWIHPWIPSIIMYPITKILPNFIEQIWIYRIIYMAIVFITIMLFADVIRRKFSWFVASISLLPMILAQTLLLAGAYVYNDAWMCLFLAISIWLINVKYESKWKYVAIVLMVLTKIYAFALVLPLMLMSRNKKDAFYVMLCGLSIGTFLIYQKVVSGDVPYLSINPVDVNKWNWSLLKLFAGNVWDYIDNWGLWVSVPMLVVGIWLWIKNKFKDIHYSYIVMAGILLAFALNSGLSGYKTFPVLYGVMFLTIPISQWLLVLEKKVNYKAEIKQEVSE